MPNFRDLYQQEPIWSILYSEKKSILMEFLTTQEFPLMPGVAHFLHQINIPAIEKCVVTNSHLDVIQ